LQLARDSAWVAGVTLNTISPGPVPSIGSFEEAIEQCEHGSAWRESMTTSPQDIAETVGFLCLRRAASYPGP